MPKGRFWRFFDEGNQRAMDHIRSQPDAGHRPMPYAKSESARQWAIAIMVGVGVVSFLGGLVWALVALVLAAPVLWRLEHHFFFRRSGSGDAKVRADPPEEE